MSELLSPGVAYGCFELLDIIEAAPMPLENAKGLGKLGVISASRVTNCAIALGWAEINSYGNVVATARGQSVRALQMTEQRLRRALLDIVEATEPPWLQNARFGRRRFLQYAPVEILQVCDEAGLVDGVDDDTVAFWDALAGSARGLHDVQLNEIGREGERLTLKYEASRTKKQPKWVALDSNEDGYDVLSQMDIEDSRRLCIEVKTSRQGLLGSFYLTRNEWESAQSLLNFCMHLWDVSKSVPRLAVLTIAALRDHLPADCGSGSWSLVKVPFSAFSEQFNDL
ncbi:DUF3883 domain-containing protein [Xanthomonas translucens]|uniref:DUF3883 domain-containing protein n=1 Tax=Xanthomonas campestris pv. translucens TaxID=343 RepID=UPI0019D559B0|nr:DUF3883 domain-containing protein [Xanthomonas translucens]QSQ31172.1 DUF3883 domain-containing protein [Xanthomonas translucens pv. translucens]